MIETQKQMETFIAHYLPLIKKNGKISFIMDVPSKTGRIMVHRFITLGKQKESGLYFGNFKTVPEIFTGCCIENVLQKMGLVSLVEKR